MPSKRERILELAQGQKPQGSTPAAFFMHFEPEFHVGERAVAKHEEFFRYTDMDFVKIQLEVSFPKAPASRPSDWWNLPVLTPNFFAPQLELVKGIVGRLGSEAVILLTLYSPFMVAGDIGGHDRLQQDLQSEPEAASQGIAKVAASMVEFVQACAERGLDGFYMSTQGGEGRRFSNPDIFEKYIKPHDLAVMRACEEVGKFNVLHICDYHRGQVGGYDDLRPFLDYPGHVVNTWDGKFSAEEIEKMFGRPYMGGLDRNGALSKGSVAEARAAAEDAMRQKPSILAADCTVPGSTPWDNLRAAVDVAHGVPQS